jgi:hypothetical protein
MANKEPEIIWLRKHIIRARILLRWAVDNRVQMGLRELIGEAETRLAWLEDQALAQKPTRTINPKIRNEAGALVRGYPLESGGAA